MRFARKLLTRARTTVTRRRAATSVLVVAGHGSLGGGEVMALQSASALQMLGVPHCLLVQENPRQVLDLAVMAGLETRVHAAHSGDPYWRTALDQRRVVRDALRKDPGLVIWCHGLRPSFATALLPGRIVHLHRNPTGLQRHAARLAAWGSWCLLVPSDTARVLLPGKLRRRARVLGNWTEEIVPVASDAPGTGRGQPVLGYLGRVAPEKGLEDLMKALTRLRADPDVHDAPRLVVAGTPLFVSRDDELRIDRALRAQGSLVSRAGWVPPRELFSQIDVLVCPSTVPEAFGLVAAEAMAARVPVVVSDAGALPSVVGPQHPYVARAGDAEDLARVIRRALVERGTPAGDAAVAAARRRWEALWSPAAGRERVRELVRELGVLP